MKAEPLSFAAIAEQHLDDVLAYLVYLTADHSLAEDLTVDTFERAIIERGLQMAEHNQTRAAELLGTTRRILKYKIDKLGIRSENGGGHLD